MSISSSNYYEFRIPIYENKDFSITLNTLANVCMYNIVGIDADIFYTYIPTWLPIPIHVIDLSIII